MYGFEFHKERRNERRNEVEVCFHFYALFFYTNGLSVVVEGCLQRLAVPHHPHPRPKIIQTSEEPLNRKQKQKVRNAVPVLPIALMRPCLFLEQEQEMRANSHSMETVNGNGWVVIPVVFVIGKSRYKVLQLSSPQLSPNKKSKKGKMTGISPFFL